jgi:hypothetical protein
MEQDGFRQLDCVLNKTLRGLYLQAESLQGTLPYLGE